MNACVVELTRQALYKEWRAAEASETQSGASVPNARTRRTLLARATRFVTEVTRRRATPAHVAMLRGLSAELCELAPDAARLLTETLDNDAEVWRAHVEDSHCAAGACFVPPPAPCQVACPAHIDIPAFVALVGKQRYSEAIKVITADNPLPYTCGLICPAPCEDACLKGASGAPLFIRPLKAIAAQYTLADNGQYPLPQRAALTGRRVAIVGSGPAGLTAAWYLALEGHQVEIFETMPEPGGMLRYGIPTCRLPPAVVDAEIANLRALGVDLHMSHPISNVTALKAKGFDAVFVAVGLQSSLRLPIEGVDFPSVVCGVDFLRSIRNGENPRVGPQVVVIGSGNVAMDVALSALRRGATQVEIVCRAKREDMRANPHEIAIVMEEGVVINNGWKPLRITREGEITFELIARVPNMENAQTMTKTVDHLLLAVGQAADLSPVEECSIDIQEGLIAADSVTLATSEEGIFAGGDVVHGARTVIEAVRAGKQAAASISAYLSGKPMRASWATPQRRTRVPPLATPPTARGNPLRPEMPKSDVAERRTERPIELGLTDSMAYDEASRCLRCDICIGCGMCELICSEMGAEALRMVETGNGRLAFVEFERPGTSCLGCGACMQVCPTGAIRVEDRPDGRVTLITGTVIQRQTMRACVSCGRPYAPTHLLERLEAMGIAGGNAYCPDCSRKQRAVTLTERDGYPRRPK